MIVCIINSVSLPVDSSLAKWTVAEIWALEVIKETEVEELKIPDTIPFVVKREIGPVAWNTPPTSASDVRISTESATTT